MKASLKDLIEREKIAHDQLDVLGESIRLKQERFPHTVTNSYALDFRERINRKIRDIAGRRVLEFGSGYGDNAIGLAKRGALVTGIDISEEYVKQSNVKATTNLTADQECKFYAMDCHNLEFEDASFDLVIGEGILHHLELDSATKEIRRVLKPGGRAIFTEPLAANPLLWIFRKLTPRARTQDEHPLTIEDLGLLDSRFQCNLSEYFGIAVTPMSALTSLARLKNPDNMLVRTASVVEKVLNSSGHMRGFNQYVLLDMERP